MCRCDTDEVLSKTRSTERIMESFDFYLHK